MQTVVRRNEQGIVYGLTYIDYKNKVVFNGSDLGKEYSAKGLIERLAQESLNESNVFLLPRSKLNNSLLPKRDKQPNLAGEKEKNLGIEKAIELVMNPEKESNYLPYQLLQKKRKKKKNLLNLWGSVCINKKRISIKLLLRRTLVHT